MVCVDEGKVMVTYLGRQIVLVVVLLLEIEL